jgi:Mo-dependent nitrogenase C-terminus
MRASEPINPKSSAPATTLVSWFWLDHSDVVHAASPHAAPIQPSTRPSFDLLRPLRRWLDSMDICDAKLAHFICKSIPSQCPFERDIILFGRTLLHIPPMCKLNPLYEEVVGLRFRALCYLADQCGEDVTAYC